MQRWLVCIIACLLFSNVGEARSDSIWDHNGSRVRLKDTAGKVEILYEDPKPLMEEAGVSPGTLLFNGDRFQDAYHGTARRFSKNCADPLEYTVSGHRINDQRIILWGVLQSRDANCNLTGPLKTDQLVFDLIEADNSGKPSASYQANDEAEKQIAEKVTACFRAGAFGDRSISIEQMRDCSGVWVTPRAFLSCALESGCPVIEDTVAGRATVDQMLAAEGLTRRSPLVLNPQLLPLMPDSATIDACRDSSANQDEFLKCSAQKTAGGRYNALLNCFANGSEGADLACFAEQLDNANLNVLIGCITGGAPTPDKVLDCTLNKDIKSKAEGIKSCIDTAGDNAAVDCLTEGLSSEQQVIARCLAGGASTDQTAGCLAQLSHQAGQAKELAGCLADENRTALGCAQDVLPAALNDAAACVAGGNDASDWASCASSVVAGANQAKAIACMSGAKGDLEAFACLAENSGSDSKGIGRCILQSDRSAAAACLLGDKPEVQAFQNFYRCASNGRDPAYLVENCTEGLFDSKTSQSLACALRAEGDKTALVACAAGAALPPDAARLVGCATSSQGATDFALCAAAPGMNEEWRTAAQCAVQSGGEPISFAGCTAGRLTLRELTKCFKGKIGEDCFGRNNTIVAGVRNALHDLTQGPGKNNEVIKAIAALDDLTGGDNSVINNPGQILGGPNSLVRNPGQIWGGDSSVFNQLAGGKNSEVRKVLRAFDPSNW
ncbi:hypothetical protein LB566_25095 [Mesorhizobium sp. CA13]|uniref:hypothetical protein n=1 Tax=Mesorhizobium sp. CA13 TaxID=2876643 RepID=UPI001CCCF49E|nr:hypothetical protein [Mesorhizobium sp. CA13]MBZ9857073.1 hypothetical protein [Mesorhizobium sp. CA13]